jgi:hypothetical protein
LSGSKFSYQSGDCQKIVPSNALGDPLCPQTQTNRDEGQYHESYGQGNHHAFRVVVIHCDGHSGVLSVQKYKDSGATVNKIFALDDADRRDIGFNKYHRF